MESFRVIKKIGQGGFGRVYLVESLVDHTKKVVKQINLKNMSESAIARATQEIKVMRQLKHFNIINYRSHIIGKGVMSILMDYADGGDLGTLIQKNSYKPWSENLILDYFVQMCLAVKYLHDRKIVHRDLKPSNFFLCKNGIIKLGDFGLAHLLPSTQAMLTTRIGSPFYLSPEICKGEIYNMKTDIWSLGCVLYEMCTLRHPFNGRAMDDVMNSIMKSKTPRIPTFYDLDLQRIVRKMLSKDPTKRPTIHDIIAEPLIKYKAFALLGRTQGRIELSHTIFHGCPAGMTPNDFPEGIIYIDDYYELQKELKLNFVQKPEEKDADEQSENGSIELDEPAAKNAEAIAEEEEPEMIPFMGIPMRLPHVQKNSSNSEKADDLRSFLDCLVGKETIDEMKNEISKLPKKPFALELKYTSKKDLAIANLIRILIEYEKKSEEK